jgi:hypothetical protein
MNSDAESGTWDCIVAGAGPAGLNAALALGTSAHTCPCCDGFEHRDERFAVLARNASASRPTASCSASIRPSPGSQDSSFSANASTFAELSGTALVIAASVGAVNARPQR